MTEDPGPAVRTYHLTLRNRVAIGALLLVALGLGTLLFVFGLALLLGLLVGGAVLGTGMKLYFTLSGQRRALARGGRADEAKLDPALEVAPPSKTLPPATPDPAKPDETPKS